MKFWFRFRITEANRKWQITTRPLIFSIQICREFQRFYWICRIKTEHQIFLQTVTVTGNWNRMRAFKRPVFENPDYEEWPRPENDPLIPKINACFLITAPKWFFSGCPNIMETQCWQTFWRRGRMLHLFFHFTRFHVPNAQSGLPYMQEKISFCLSLQMVFYQPKFNLSPMQEFILKNENRSRKNCITVESFSLELWKICDLIFSSYSIK